MKTLVARLLILLAPTLAFGQPLPLKTFPLSSVRLLDGPFQRAQQTDMQYILALNTDRLLVPFLREAGLEPKAESYGNW